MYAVMSSQTVTVERKILRKWGNELNDSSKEVVNQIHFHNYGHRYKADNTQTDGTKQTAL